VNKRLLGLVVGAAAMALTQMTPAHAGTATQSYVGGGVMGTGLVSGANANNTRVGGVQFDGVSGGHITVTVKDASNLGVAANVSFRGPADPNDPTGSIKEISSTRLCGTSLNNWVIPGGTTRVIVFMYEAYPETPATTGFGCAGYGKGIGPATTGTVTATWGV
jgi:hypothetical protein